MIYIAHPNFAVDKIEKNEIGEACRAYGEGNAVQCVLEGNTGVRPPLWGSRRKWQDNNQMQLQEVMCDVMDWVELFDEM